MLVIFITIINLFAHCQIVFARYKSSQKSNVLVNQCIDGLSISQVRDDINNLPVGKFNDNSDPSNSLDLPSKTNNGNVQENLKLPSDNVLKGAIEHSARLEPVPDYLQAGAVFNEKTLKGNLASSRIWYRIPNWLAGTWHQKYALILKSSNPTLDRPGRKYLVEADLFYGREIDKNNNIWDTNIMPKFQSINAQNSAPEIVNVMTFYFQPSKYQDSSFTCINKTRQIHINKSTGRIIKVRQSEGINSFTLAEPGVLKRISSIKWFDDSGSPLFEDQRLIYMNLKKAFAPIEFSKWGENLHDDFIQYLKNSDLENLIPN